MEDADLIACVYPCADIDRKASKAIEKSSRYVSPRLQCPSTRYGRRDRESTRSPERPNMPAYHYLPGLELRFSDIPRTSRGIVFGCDPNSDVVLPDIPSISYHHFSLTFDKERRLIVRDWGSFVGTEEPPIVHRDIKPGNILVQHRFPGDIYVKFGDFGLSRDGCDLSTICGSRQYLAPEIYLGLQYINSGGTERRSYTPTVDIWSLGVVVYELMCQLPQYTENYAYGGTAWCKKFINRFEKNRKQRPNELRQFLLSAMVVMSPESRCSAQDCLDEAVLLSNATEDGCPTPTPALDDQMEQTILRYSLGDHTAKNQNTMLWQSRSFADSHAAISTDTGRYIRSDAPPPSTPPLTLRHTFIVSCSSSQGYRMYIGRG